MNRIVTYEHRKLKVKRDLTRGQLAALTAWHGAGNEKYFDLIHKGIKFNSYVGVLQVGPLTIEVLPKADADPATVRTGELEAADNPWRSMLIEMLRVVPTLRLSHPTASHLRTRPNSILEFYFQLFIAELEELVRRGLIKQYRDRRENATALRGRLLVTEQLRYNLVHRERFYVEYATYDRDHPLNRVLRQALELIQRINRSAALAPRIRTLLLAVPELPPVARLSDDLFTRLRFGRKTKPYQPAMAIARLLLLRYHPDVSQGANHVLALLFDMNSLWENFLLVALRRELRADGISVQAPGNSPFWSGGGLRVRHRPDLLLRRGQEVIAVIDAKWKLPKGRKPSAADLRQLFTYGHYFGTPHLALAFPTTQGARGARPQVQGVFAESRVGQAQLTATLLYLPVKPGNVRTWMAAIGAAVRQALPQPPGAAAGAKQVK